MKNMLFKLFKVLIWIVLAGKVLNWFLHFDDQVNHLLNTAMFCLIGLAYLVVGYSWDNKLTSIVMVTCGLFLLVRNFLPQHIAIDILGIVSIVTPLLIARFSNKKGEPTKISIGQKREENR